MSAMSVSPAQPSRLGWWYASGPADREYTVGDSAWNLHRVVSDTSNHPGCVIVENGGGQRFPLGRDLLEQVALPPERLADYQPRT